jgi:hypothetical protein
MPASVPSRSASIRVPLLRADNGAVHIISNDLITTLSNMILAPIEVMGGRAARGTRRGDPSAHQDGTREDSASGARTEPARERTAGVGPDRVSAGGGCVKGPGARGRRPACPRDVNLSGSLGFFLSLNKNYWEIPPPVVTHPARG